MMPGGNSDEDPSSPNPIDAWEVILRGIAEDVSAMRRLVTVAMVTGWLIFLAIVARVLFD